MLYLYMFSEKNIPRLIIITPILSIFILTFLLLFYFIKAQQNYFTAQSEKQGQEYIQKQKTILQKEINTAFAYIEYQKNLLIDNTQKEMQIQMKTFERLISTQSFSPSRLRQYIEQNENENSDFMVYDGADKTLIKNKNVFFDQAILHAFLTSNKEFALEDETTLYLFRSVPQSEYILILKKDIFYTLDDLKNSIARWFERIRFEGNNYFWIHTNTNILIAHPYRKDAIGTDDTMLLDGENTLFVQKFVRLAIKNPQGSFVEYMYPKPQDKIPTPKLGFVKLYDDWHWVIGAGIYLDDIKKEIEAGKQILEQKIDDYIETTLVIVLFLSCAVLLVSIAISKKINQSFQEYQAKVAANELKLRDLNQNLHAKITLAIAKEKEKDRAMLHQSRLARIGEMLNLIAHQWRQPLSRLSGIVMELETRVSFDKADEQYLLTCASDASKTIQFMSATIEDFRNFFKPEKQKEEFSIAEACRDAIAILQDTLDSQNIKLELYLADDKHITSYKREFAQVILNLLINAKDAHNETQSKNAKITLRIGTQGARSIIWVQDNAGGIKQENLDVIFEPYFSTKKSHGTGLGLYMSKMIIETNMHGKLSVKNKNNGALFTIVL